jgi:L-iditol 2-dehydrogenase
MKALVKTERGVGHVSLQSDWPRPVGQPGWVIVEVVGCGICGTDLHIVEDTHKNWPPVVLGHEYTGRIVEVGEGVDRWQVGDRVVCEQHTLACFQCDPCRRGAIHLCANKRSPGWGIDGAFADFVRLPASLLHRVPDNVDFRSAVLTEPTAICITGLDRVNLHSGERVAVIGPGPIGIITGLLARASGASHVVVAGRASSARRLELAESLGLDTITLTEDTTIDAPFDVVFDTTGESLNLAVSWVRTMGRVLEQGFASGATVPLALNAAMFKAVSIHMSMSSEYSTWDRALAMMGSGSYDPRPLVKAFPLDDWEVAFAAVENRDVVKAVITPGQEADLDLLA